MRRQITAIPITTTLHIDGLLNEPEWQLATPASGFIQIEPYQGQPATQSTQVRVLYNKQYLYFGVFARDSLGKKAIRATDFKRDFNITQHDLVTLLFDGFNDKRNAMLLASNAYGAQRDLLAFDDLYFDLDWDGLWKVRTNRTDSGWYAEFAIPWQTLRYPHSDDSLQTWGFNMYRVRRLTNETTAFSPYPRSIGPSRMDYAGLLTNLQPPPPKPNVRVQPYFLSSYDHYKNYGPGVNTNEANAKVGGDLKWAVNSNAVLDLTVNTDFAQADADRAVNNVTRFNVFFPERRQFFLENASLFGVGVSQAGDASGGSMHIQPFFSRSIGLDTNGNPIPIDAGARFVDRSSKINYGGILMRQRGVDGSPATNFFVGRMSENFGRQNRIGGLVTIKNTPSGSNIVSAVDGFFRLADDQSLNTMVMQSTDTKSGKKGMAGFAQYYYSNNHFKMWWTESVVTKNFDPQMGFVSRYDVVATTPGIFYYYRGDKLPFKKILRAWEPSIVPEFYHQASTGRLTERTFTIYPVWLNFISGAYFGYGIIPTYENLADPFQPLGVTIPTGKYNYVQHQIWASTDPSKIVNVQLLYNGGKYFNGRIHSADWVVQFAPIPNISITGHLNRNHFFEVGEAKTSTTIDLYSVEGRFALNPRIQLIAFYQQNSDNNSKNYNIRFSWEYQPLSYIYVVFNHTGFNNILTAPQAEDHLIAKISYLKQL
ncbi:MAG TPA: carbohydrate binding family 9 domain-containing protein [Chitinophagaceae bacterium]|nr:carbohydrate binding family 9 domain-containing protein [Chitinophagaceae bacterium]